MSKQPLPMNPSFVKDLPPCPDTPYPMSTQPLLEPLILEPPVEPILPIPWNTHQCQYLSMEDFIKHMMQNPVSNPLDDPASPMEDVPPLEPEPTTHYLPDSPKGKMHTLSPDKSPTEPWQWWLNCPESPVSQKHSLLPNSLSSAPIQQHTSWEGSYQSIMPQMLSPIASTLPQSQSYQLTSSKESVNSPLSMQTPAADNDNKLLLNWVILAHDYQKG